LGFDWQVKLDVFQEAFFDIESMKISLLLR